MKNEELKKLFVQYYSKMYRVARTMLYDEQESKDVVSDIFERLLNGNIMGQRIFPVGESIHQE